MEGFLKRHPELTVRVASLIKRGRARVSHNDVNEFFNRFEKVMEGVLPANIFNYDETAMQDNPGCQKALFQRGCKYPEQIQDHSKTSVSVMFCASATGNMVPPYVVYKAGNMYRSWMKGGIKGSRYTVTTSGWFDGFTFSDWFHSSFLPHVRRLPGKKVLIGDNLSSHITMEVIDSCRTNNIEFVCFPPNSTDKMQPLDVGYFRSLKGKWREQLRKYAKEDPSQRLLDKVRFPAMLKEVVEALDTEVLMENAFTRCGLVPLNRQKVLDRIPSARTSLEMARDLDSVLAKTLEVRRFGDGKKKQRGRGKKVPAGKSYTEESEEEKDSEEDSEEKEDSEEEKDSEEEDNVDVDELLGGGDEVETRRSKRKRWSVESEGEENVLEDQVEDQMEEEEEEEEEEVADLGCAVGGSYVIAMYEGQWFLAQVCFDQANVKKGYTKLSYLVLRGENCFVWGEKPDIMETLNIDIVVEKVVPELQNNRGHLGLNKKDLKSLKSLLVVVYLPSHHLLFFSFFFTFFLDGSK